MRVLLPESVEQACELLARHPEAVPMAGGTDLLVHWPQNLEAHRGTFMDLSGLAAELRPHRLEPEQLVLGGMTTYWDVVRDRETVAAFPLLAAAARQVGAVQIQTRGTWAGNIVNASPAADGVPVLMAYDAEVELISERGAETVPLDRFYTGYKEMRRRPDQLVRAIRLPRRRYDLEVFEKVGSRRAQAITKVGLTLTHRAAGDGDGNGMEGVDGKGNGRWRVIANSMAPTVCRCQALERLLGAGTPIAEPDDLLQAVREDVAPIDDIRSTAAYRERVFSRVLFHALRQHGA